MPDTLTLMLRWLFCQDQALAAWNASKPRMSEYCRGLLVEMAQIEHLLEKML